MKILLDFNSKGSKQKPSSLYRILRCKEPKQKKGTQLYNLLTFRARGNV